MMLHLLFDAGNGEYAKARLALLHYAHCLNNQFVISLVAENVDIKEREEACRLVSFYWDMLDAAMDDQPLGIEVVGDADLQGLMNQLFNIFSEYLNKQGYGDVWDEVSTDVT